jgi:hypothetical protein
MAKVKTMSVQESSAEKDMAHLLDTFGYHIRCIATNEPGKFGLGLSSNEVSAYVSVEIQLRSEPEKIEAIWDTVLIDGVSCGNRSGGCREYAKRCAPVFLAAAARLQK